MTFWKTKRVVDAREFDYWRALYLDGLGSENRTPAQDAWLRKYLGTENECVPVVTPAP